MRLQAGSMILGLHIFCKKSKNVIENHLMVMGLSISQIQSYWKTQQHGPLNDYTVPRSFFSSFFFNRDKSYMLLLIWGCFYLILRATTVWCVFFYIFTQRYIYIFFVLTLRRHYGHFCSFGSFLPLFPATMVSVLAHCCP